MKQNIKVTVGLVAILALTGCSGGGGAVPAATVTVTTTATTTTTATVTASPSSPVELVPGSLADLLTALEQQGLTCEGWTTTDDTMGECDGGTMLSVFPDTEAGRATHKAAVNLALVAITTQDRSDVSLLVGRNWFVRASTEGAVILQGRVGGVVLGTS